MTVNAKVNFKSIMGHTVCDVFLQYVNCFENVHTSAKYDS